MALGSLSLVSTVLNVLKSTRPLCRLIQLGTNIYKQQHQSALRVATKNKKNTFQLFVNEYYDC